VLLTRMKLLVLGALVLGVAGSVAFTQAPSGEKRKGYGMDPDAIFDKYAKGKDVIVVSEVEVDERFARFISTDKLREQMTNFLQEKGITNGQITREQYRDYSQWSMQKMREQWEKGGGKLGGGSKSDGDKDKKDGGNTSQSDSNNDDLDGKARDLFKRLDTNNDGVLTVDELQAAGKMGSRLYEDRDKYDLNKDGKIDVNEYVEYYKARYAKGKGDKGNKGDRSNWNRELDEDKPKVIPEEKRVVYRIGSLPKDLPKWFEEADKDKDGQIGLYEWKAAGKEVKEFLAMDANGDGFVTVEEILRFQKAALAKKADEGKPLSLMPVHTVIAPPGASTQTKGKSDKGEGKGKYGDRGKGKGKGNYSIPGR
jgi:Ca2+-binding EF-hand superfamily protein